MINSIIIVDDDDDDDKLQNEETGQAGLTWITNGQCAVVRNKVFERREVVESTI